MVDADVSSVELALSSGGLGCPDCAGVLRRWGWARARTVRGISGVRVWLRPRRSRCRPVSEIINQLVVLIVLIGAGGFGLIVPHGAAGGNAGAAGGC